MAQHLPQAPYYRQLLSPEDRGWSGRCVTGKPAGTGPQAGWANINKRRAGGRRVGAAQRPLLSSPPPPELFMFRAVAVPWLWDITCQALFTDLNLHNRSEERLLQHSLHPDRSTLCLHGNLPAMGLCGTAIPPPPEHLQQLMGQVQSRQVRKWKSSTEPFKFHNQ